MLWMMRVKMTVVKIMSMVVDMSKSPVFGDSMIMGMDMIILLMFSIL